MKYDLNTFNEQSPQEVETALFNCCGSTKWVKNLMNYFPFSSETVLFDQARQIWFQDCTEVDYLEAFSHHP